MRLLSQWLFFVMISVLLATPPVIAQDALSVGSEGAFAGMVFVFVPGGCFRMGDEIGAGDQDEQPVHEVCLDGFWMGKFEVTQGQWLKLMAANPAVAGAGDNYPVEQVSWDDTQEYIRKLNHQSGRNFRLPTEAEWEYACRSGGRQEKYCGGNEIAALGWYAANSGGATRPVGTGTANGLGIYDMSGNVNEWVGDWYGGYRGNSLVNPSGPAVGSGRVVRGGSWFLNVWRLRSTHRTGRRPDNRDDDLGFRLVLPLDGKGNSD